jgi:hypothetical protein
MLSDELLNFELWPGKAAKFSGAVGAFRVRESAGHFRERVPTETVAMKDSRNRRAPSIVVRQRPVRESFQCGPHQ